MDQIRVEPAATPSGRLGVVRADTEAGCQLGAGDAPRQAGGVQPGQPGIVAGEGRQGGSGLRRAGPEQGLPEHAQAHAPRSQGTTPFSVPLLSLSLAIFGQAVIQKCGSEAM